MANRLFVKLGNDSESPFLYCGGPDSDEALEGLTAALRHDVQDMLADEEAMYLHEITFDVRDMTDDEVKALVRVPVNEL